MFEILPGEFIEERDVLALVALASGGVTPQDGRTLQVYERLRRLGLAQRGDAANDDWELPTFGLTDDGMTALHFHWTAIAEMIERLARERRG